MFPSHVQALRNKTTKEIIKAFSEMLGYTSVNTTMHYLKQFPGMNAKLFLIRYFPDNAFLVYIY